MRQAGMILLTDIKLPGRNANVTMAILKRATYCIPQIAQKVGTYVDIRKLFLCASKWKKSSIKPFDLSFLIDSLLLFSFVKAIR
jgi:hypothetical protein